MVWSAAGMAWLIGFVSNFLIAPINSGMGLGDSYASFQSGSNFGNVLALVLFSGAALLSGGVSSRWSGPISVRALVAYGVPAVFSLYPAAVVSNAVAHVVAVEDGFEYHDWLARPLLMSGFVALAAALISGMWARKR